MSEWLQYAVYYIVVGLLIWGYYVFKRARKGGLNRRTLEEAKEAGMMTPPSLHPVINHNICIGCEACVHACPEFPAHNVLGLISGKANLVSPTDCIGHGACKTACPVGAISLVYGTAERGVDIPNVSPEFETNVPGIYIAGELGGMGLIRNAVSQGTQAIEYLQQNLKPVEGALDVAIVGAGPAGFAATLAAQEKGMRYVTLEQDSLGGTVAKFPRGKLVMTAPAQLPLYGEMNFREAQKEEIISFWTEVEKHTGVNIHYGEEVRSIDRQEHGFLLTTSANTYRVSAVLLALGRRGTPRKLGVPGEDESNKVIYNVVDPAEFRGKKVCVVGGGDSALEAAHSIAEQPDTEVTLSYRSSAFTRAKRKNRDKVEQMRQQGRLRVLMESEVLEVRPDKLVLRIKHDGQDKKAAIGNDKLIVCAGGILPTGFLRDIGVNVETKYGTA